MFSIYILAAQKRGIRKLLYRQALVARDFPLLQVPNEPGILSLPPPSFQTPHPRIFLPSLIIAVHRSGLFNLILGKKKVDPHRVGGEVNFGSKLHSLAYPQTLAPSSFHPTFSLYLSLLSLSTCPHVTIQLVIPKLLVLSLIFWNYDPLRGHSPALPYGTHTPQNPPAVTSSEKTLGWQSSNSQCQPSNTRR